MPWICSPGHRALALQMPCKTLNDCLVDAAQTLGLRGSLRAAFWRVAGGKPCSPLCITVIPPIKDPASLGHSTGAAHRQLIQPAPAVSSAGLGVQCTPQRRGFSKCSTPEPPSFSPSAIESWAFAYLISSLFSEMYLC